MYTVHAAVKNKTQFYQEVMSRPKGSKERPTPHYIVQLHLTLNDYHTFLFGNYSQVGSFPLWSLREGVHLARFHLMSHVDAGVTGYFDATIF